MENQTQTQTQTQTIDDLVAKLKPTRKKGRPSAILNRDFVVSTLKGMTGVGSVVPLQMYIKVIGQDGKVMRVRGNRVFFTDICSAIPKLEVIKKDTEELHKKYGKMSASVIFDTDEDLIKVAGIYFGNGSIELVSDIENISQKDHTIPGNLGDNSLDDEPTLD